MSIQIPKRTETAISCLKFGMENKEWIEERVFRIKEVLELKLEKEPASKGSLAFPGGMDAGSTTFKWRAVPDETGHYWEEAISLT